MAISKEKEKTTLVRVKQKFQVTLPLEVREALRLQEGDLLEASVENNRIFLNPKALIDRPDIDTAFEDGIRDYRNSKGKGVFSSVKEFKQARKR